MTTPDTTVEAVPPDPDSPPSALPADETPPQHQWKGLIEWALILGGALFFAFLIKVFLFQAFWIPSESMDPTLKIDDRVFVNKLSYKFHDVHRGDIVVFDRPPAEQGGDPSIKDLIKRVVALPGEKVEGRDGHVWVNDKMLDEPYLVAGTVTTDFAPKVVPPKSYWVMGDNRLRSKDSRYFGPISDDLIVGRAFIRIWPLTHIHLL